MCQLRAFRSILVILCQLRAFRSISKDKELKSAMRMEYITARKNFDKNVRFYERQYNNKIVNNLEKVSSSNPREFWRKIKNLGPRKAKIPFSVYNENNILCNDTNVVLKKWKSEFQELYSSGNKRFNEYYQDMLNHKCFLEKSDNVNELINGDISYDEIEKIIDKANKNKACGFDGVFVDVLKNNECKYALYKLFNLCFSYGKVPGCWEKAIITPVPKNSMKDPHVPTEYRGVSLLSHIGKIYSQILNNRVVSYCEEIDLFCDEQNGFRQSRSCEDHIFSLTTIIRNRLKFKKDTYVAFIDMQKAFDWVNRDLLWYKLLVHNITGKIYWAIRSLYEHNISCVKLHGLLSEWFNVDIGVRQGDNLSPTLFGIFINDLAIDIKNLGLGIPIGNRKIPILLYADDIAILAENESDLQKLLNKLHEWCEKWQLQLNIKKSQIVHFRNKCRKKTDSEFYVGQSKLGIVSSYKYLGISLNEFLDYNVCAQELAEAGGRALGAIIAKFKTFKNIGFETFSKLYNSGVIPISDYASAIWGYRNSGHAEKIQNRACRYFLGVNAKTPLSALHGDMGWTRPKYRMYLNILRFYNRLIKMKNDRLTFSIFEYDLQNISNDNWSGDLENILEDINMHENMILGSEVDINVAKEKLLILSDLEWQDSLSTKTKLRTYVKFKAHLETENYVSVNLKRNERSLLAKLRSGTLPLSIEKGRYQQKPLHERVCPVCQINAVEDEIHFVICCDGYYAERSAFFDYISQNICSDFQELDLEDKFLKLMKLQNCHLRKFVKFLVKIWECRKNKLLTC